MLELLTKLSCGFPRFGEPDGVHWPKAHIFSLAIGANIPKHPSPAGPPNVQVKIATVGMPALAQ